MIITAEILEERSIKITAKWTGDYYGKRISFRFHSDELHEFVVNDTVEKKVKYRYCGFSGCINLTTILAKYNTR